MSLKILRECSDFLEQSKGNPVYKTLISNGKDIRKVKVRKRKQEQHAFENILDNAFQHTNIRQRGVFVAGNRKSLKVNSGMDIFYIFPVNGFKFVFSPTITDTTSKTLSEEYKKFTDIMSEEEAVKSFTDLLSFSYTNENLEEAILSGNEIIVYGISHFYAVRESSIIDYNRVFGL